MPSIVLTSCEGRGDEGEKGDGGKPLTLESIHSQGLREISSIIHFGLHHKLQDGSSKLASRREKAHIEDLHSVLGLLLINYGILDHLFTFLSLWAQKWPYFDHIDVLIKQKRESLLEKSTSMTFSLEIQSKELLLTWRSKNISWFLVLYLGKVWFWICFFTAYLIVDCVTKYSGSYLRYRFLGPFLIFL